MNTKSIENAMMPCIESLVESGFHFTSPILFKEGAGKIDFIVIDVTDLGRVNMGRSSILFREVEELVEEHSTKYGVSSSLWEPTLKDWSDLPVSLINMDVDTDSGIQVACEQVSNYINERGNDFWSIHSNYVSIVDVIKTLDDKLLNQVVFPGIKGIMRRLIIVWLANDIDYYLELKLKYSKLLCEYVAKKPRHNDKYSAYLSLVEMIDSNISNEDHPA